MWEVDYGYVEDWLDEQDTETVAAVFAAFEILGLQGPTLGRPLVDTLKGSNVSNLKELRPASPGVTEIRVLFAFDLARKAVMLLAGDKAKGANNKDRWSGWYKNAIPKAEALFAAHQMKFAESKKEAGQNGKPAEIFR